MSKTFTIEVNLAETFTIGDIWPDGDAPADPTVEDVKAVFLKKAYNVHQTCSDWGLEIRKEDVEIHMHDAAATERMRAEVERLKQVRAQLLVEVEAQAEEKASG